MLIICGIAVVDIIASRLPRVANPGELIFTPIQVSPGGHACNVSMDLAQIGFPKNELRVIFPVGVDVFGNFLEKSLKKQGLRLHVFQIASAPTSMDLILVAEGEDRRYHADPGANRSLPSGYVLSILKNEKPTLFYAGGVGLLEKFDKSLEKILKKARERGAFTFIDIVAPYQKTWDFLRPGFRWMDIFHCNEDEAKEITGCANIKDALKEISRLGVKFLFITRGAKGVIAQTPKARINMPAFKVRVADPTGAGDAFCAGLIHKIYKLLLCRTDIFSLPGEEWKKILVYASACGAACCTGVGTISAVKPRIIKELLHKQGQDLLDTTKVVSL